VFDITGLWHSSNDVWFFVSGEFANNLPDYQKIEIMVFVMGKVPLPSESSQR